MYNPSGLVKLASIGDWHFSVTHDSDNICVVFEPLSASLDRNYGYAWELLLSSAGAWDPVQRVLHLTCAAERTIGFESSTSVRKGCWYTESAAAHMNFFAFAGTTMDIYMNEVRDSKFQSQKFEKGWARCICTVHQIDLVW